MRLPDFLLIGAMKSGTTSLWRDLGAHPDVYFPAVKEPHHLAAENVLTRRGRRRYADLYRRASPLQLCGDASTGYSKLPDVPGVAERARQLLGTGLRVIYLVREPIDRMVSQHHHEMGRGEIDCGFDDAIHRYPRLVDYSRYGYQLSPWLGRFGIDRVLVVRFEDYVRDRRAVTGSVCRFLGIPARPAAIDLGAVHNRTAERSVPGGLLWRTSRTAAYQRWIRPLLSPTARERLRRHLLHRMPPRPAPPRLETVDLVLERLREDGEVLRGLLGPAAPHWDLEQVRRRFAPSEGRTPAACALP